MTIKVKLNGDWKEISRLLKMQYPVLSENDLSFEPGEENRLVERIAARLKMPQEEVRELLFRLKIKVAEGEMPAV